MKKSQSKLLCSTWLKVPGRCHTKNSYAGAKGYGRRKDGRPGDYERALEWEATAKRHITAQLHIKGIKELPMIEAERDVCMDVCVLIFGTHKNRECRKRADLQNYFKSICDAMQGVLYKNDNQIVNISGHIYTVDDRSEEEVWIRVRLDERRQLNRNCATGQWGWIFLRR